MLVNAYYIIFLSLTGPLLKLCKQSSLIYNVPGMCNYPVQLVVHFTIIGLRSNYRPGYEAGPKITIF